MVLKHSYYLKHKELGSLIRVDFCEGKAQNLKLMSENISPAEFLEYTQLFISSLALLNGAKRKELDNNFYISHTARKVSSTKQEASQATSLWRKLSKELLGVEYDLTNQDAAKLTALGNKVTEARLRHFFKNWKVRTVGNFCKSDTQNSITINLNEKTHNFEKLEFPKEPNQAYYEKLTTDKKQKCAAYWQMLGYKAVQRVVEGKYFIQWKKENN